MTTEAPQTDAPQTGQIVEDDQGNKYRVGEQVDDADGSKGEDLPSPEKEADSE